MAVYSCSSNTVDLAVDPLITCSLCLSEYGRDDMYQLDHCGCLYCTACMRQYLTILITEGSVITITCPDAMCRRRGKITRAEVERIVEPAVYQRFVRLKFQKEVELDPGRTWCPEAGCETVCHVCPATAASNDPLPAKPVQCPTCDLVFCSVCKCKWHDGKTCDENFRSVHKDGDGIPFTSPENAEIKRCPLCFVPIERTDGCAQMMCKRCKHVFCWYCLTALDDDFLLRHYDKGPCKNKLGHSRASVIWHRAQVLGIFAGFGVLLLVVSPLLLLAAPCIICCKCAKASKCCEDDEDLEAS